MKKNYQRFKQPCPKELTDTLMAFLKRKFYTDTDGDRHFAQDRSRLMAWVVLWPASWLNARGVSIHGDAYRDLFFKVMFQADAHRSERIKYRPAWLKMVLQSHFKIHGEEYLAEGKNLRNITDHLLLVAGQSRQPAADPVRNMAEARQILTSMQPKKRLKTAPKTALNLELNLS